MADNNNLRDHEVYDSFYASDKQTAQFKAAIHITARSKWVFIIFLICLSVYIFFSLPIIFGNDHHMPYGIFHIIFSVLFFGFTIFTYITMLREKTYLFGFLTCVPVAIFGSASLDDSPVLLSVIGESESDKINLISGLIVMGPLVLCAMISFLLMARAFSNPVSMNQTASNNRKKHDNSRRKMKKK